MPILNNVGKLMYVLAALFGGAVILLKLPNLSLTGLGALSIGTVMSFLSMSRSLSQTVGQLAMQLPIYTMGTAGAKRVFELMDQEPEEDEGFVTLVHTVRGASGSFRSRRRAPGAGPGSISIRTGPYPAWSCAARWEWRCRRLTSSPVPSWTISASIRITIG